MVATTPAGSQPAARSSAIACAERRRVHGAVAVDRDLAHALAADAQDHGRALDGRVRLRRAVEPQRRRCPQARLRRVPGGVLTGRREGGEAADGGRVVEDAVEVSWQAQALAQPVHRDALQLRAHGRGAPQEGIGVQAAGDHLAQQADAGRTGREVGEVRGVLPVRDVGHDLRADVAQDVLQRLGVLRWRPVQAPGQLTRRDGREDGVVLDVLEVVGHDVCGLVEGSPQLGGGHVARRRALRGVETRR